ncbi:MAG: hypothetical protein RI885_416 [Actinomycetota bacterium]|jgi:uncharacterized membrane protein
MAERRRSSAPRLASDTARGWVAVGLALVPASPAQFLLLQTDRGGEPFDTVLVSYFLYWSSIGLCYALLPFVVFWRADGETLARWLRATAPRTRSARLLQMLGGGGSVSWAVTGSVVSVAAVLLLSIVPRYRQDPVVVAMGIAVVVSSMAMTISAYAVRYARMSATVGGIRFPDGATARFSDFVYLAVQVATTFSSSDVSLETSAARRVVTTNSLISFAFNTVIVALLVSIIISAGA